MWDDLPEDVSVRILLLLPVKDVIRCSLLQKSWYSLVHSKSFVESYDRHSRLHNTNPSLLILGSYSFGPKLSLRHNNALLDEYTPLYYCCPRGPVHSISNSCNGLICLFDGCRFYLWNPIIRKTLTLPYPNYRLGMSRFLGLGFVDETSDYKVCMVNENHQVELYSLQHHSWKILVHPEPAGTQNCTDHMVNTPVSVGSSLYWLRIKDHKNVVGVFNFKDEDISDISIPEDWDSPMASFVRLRKHSESSIAFVRSVCDLRTHSACCHIHVMDVNTKTWRKHSIESSNWGKHMDILGFNKEGDEIISWVHFIGMHNDRIPRMCTHKNGKFTDIIKPVHGVEASNYVTSLALLDVVAKPRGC